MWRCTVCNWMYDESVEKVPFEDLSPEYTCPQCGSPKSAFERVDRKAVSDDAQTVADALVESLAEMGVRRVYGIPGHSNLPLIDALRRSNDVDLITTRHEHAAAFMACGRAKLTGELGVCVSIAGPGATNLVTGLMDAAADRAPVLALVGQVPEIFLGSEAFQEIDQIELFRSFSVFAETVGRPSQLPRLTGMAVKYALGRQGVSVLSLPTDVLAEPAVEERWDRRGRLVQPRVVPSDAELEKAADLVDGAESPGIVAGWGSRGGDVKSLAERIMAPIVTTSRAKGVIPESHHLSLGVLGSIGNPHAPPVLANCDLLIVLGSGFRQSNLIPGARILQIDHDPVRVGRSFSVEVGLIGDVPLTLSRLLPMLRQRDSMRTGTRELLDSARGRLNEDRRDDMSQDGTPVHPGFLVGCLRRHVDHDAVIAVDVGDHTYWFYKRFPCEDEFTLMSASMASMGFALPAAIASQFEQPSRQVVCVTGDGGFAMVMGDFTTAVKHELPIKVVVFNDSQLKNIRKEQHHDGYAEYGTELLNPDFALFASSAGALGIRVEDGRDLDEAVGEILEHDGPALLDVVLDPEVMLPGVVTVASS